MNKLQTTYRGFVLTPLAAFDDGQYAAMLIVCDENGMQRASGVLGHFPSADEACCYALTLGMEDIDRRIQAYHSAQQYREDTDMLRAVAPPSMSQQARR